MNRQGIVLLLVLLSFGLVLLFKAQHPPLPTHLSQPVFTQKYFSFRDVAIAETPALLFKANQDSFGVEEKSFQMAMESLASLLVQPEHQNQIELLTSQEQSTCLLSIRYAKYQDTLHLKVAMSWADLSLGVGLVGLAHLDSSGQLQETLVTRPAHLDLAQLKDLQKSLRGLNRQALLSHSDRHTLLVAQMSDISFL